MPNTIASEVQLFKGSGLIAEKSLDNGWREDWKFGYGRFVGLDRKLHLGIERRPFAVPWTNGSGGEQGRTNVVETRVSLWIGDKVRDVNVHPR